MLEQRQNAMKDGFEDDLYYMSSDRKVIRCSQERRQRLTGRTGAKRVLRATHEQAWVKHD